MSCNKVNNTVTFDEKVKGWTSFHSYNPDFMVGMNNGFYSFRNGDLYVHDSDSVSRNNFYGDQYPSKVSLMVNESPSDIKELQAVSLEGSASWDTLITAYVSNVTEIIRSTITEAEYVKKEGIWYAYTRRNELGSYDSRATYGIGVITDIVGDIITVNGGSSTLTTGDTIVRGQNLVPIGVISSISKVSGELVLNLTSSAGLLIGDFVLGKKESRVEGSSLKGYTIRIDLTSNNPDKVELFSVNSEVIKSFS